MKPYKNLSSKNLSLLLLITRLTTVMAIAAIVLSTIGFFSQFFMQTGFGVNQWSVISIAILPSSLTVLFCSGIVASIIAFEESYRKKSEAYISSLN
ncbi:hypothetical protein [Cognaticolwellia mytili]|uniref:hypothetical protein n=1 Tax=Cognaticolwellia mytili TaxID=1888913 RepID=UPI000A16E59B|nr:hypothetical protein [Cognaticolwellia mytili]